MNPIGLLASAFVVAAPQTPQPQTPLPAPPSQASPSTPPASAPPSADVAPQTPQPDVEGSIRAAYANAENQQGPLDGRWRLSGADGAGLFAFVLADPGGAPSPSAASPTAPSIEGAWRDLRRDDPTASGLLASVLHLGDGVEIRFYAADPANPTVVRLHPGAGGSWEGDLVEGGTSRPVVMKRF